MTAKTNVGKRVDAYTFTRKNYTLDGEGGRAENGTHNPTVSDRLFDKLPLVRGGARHVCKDIDTFCKLNMNRETTDRLNTDGPKTIE